MAANLLLGLEKDACDGDSGGPFVVNSKNGYRKGDWTVAGIISYGYICGDGSVVTRVGNYYDWILKEIKNNWMWILNEECI